MLVVDVWTLVLPSLFRTSAGRPDGVGHRDERRPRAVSRSHSLRGLGGRRQHEQRRDRDDDEGRLTLTGLPSPCRSEPRCHGRAPGTPPYVRHHPCCALLIAVLALGVAVTGAVAAGKPRTRDRVALRGVKQSQDRATERKIDSLLRKMTLEEKLDQLTLLSDGQMKERPDEARKPIGAVFSETDPVLINKYQHQAVDESRLHIPILFAFDTIHGFRTIFRSRSGPPSSFDPSIAQTDHRIGAFESAAVGSSRSTARWWTSPTSLAGDAFPRPRRGPVPDSVMAAAGEGREGNDYSASDKVVTSVKHYVAYGQPGEAATTTPPSVAHAAVEHVPVAVQGGR